jgi:hypothetical protein
MRTGFPRTAKSAGPIWFVESVEPSGCNTPFVQRRIGKERGNESRFQIETLDLLQEAPGLAFHGCEHANEGAAFE